MRINLELREAHRTQPLMAFFFFAKA